MKRLTFYVCLSLAFSTGEASFFRRGVGEKKVGVRRQATKATSVDGGRVENERTAAPAGGQASMTAMVFNLVNNVAGTPRLSDNQRSTSSQSYLSSCD